MSPKRPDDRDVFVSKATPRTGIPVELPEEVTGQYQGPELAYYRSKRPTHERVERLEAKADLTAVTLAAMVAKLDTVLDFIKTDRNHEHQTKQLHISTRGKVIIGVVGALCTAAGIIATAALSGCM